MAGTQITRLLPDGYGGRALHLPGSSQFAGKAGVAQDQSVYQIVCQPPYRRHRVVPPLPRDGSTGDLDGTHPVPKITRLGLDGYGVRRAASFGGRVGSRPTEHGKTRFALEGYGTRNVGSFAGKTFTAALGDDNISQPVFKPRWREPLNIAVVISGDIGLDITDDNQPPVPLRPVMARRWRIPSFPQLRDAEAADAANNAPFALFLRRRPRLIPILPTGDLTGQPDDLTALDFASAQPLPPNRPRRQPIRAIAQAAVTEPADEQGNETITSFPRPRRQPRVPVRTIAYGDWVDTPTLASAEDFATSPMLRKFNPRHAFIRALSFGDFSDEDEESGTELIGELQFRRRHDAMRRFIVPPVFSDLGDTPFVVDTDVRDYALYFGPWLTAAWRKRHPMAMPSWRDMTTAAGVASHRGRVGGRDRKIGAVGGSESL